jgi:transposase
VEAGRALLPAPKPRRHRYRATATGDRAALAGIVFVLKTGIAWNSCPPAWSAARE